MQVSGVARSARSDPSLGAVQVHGIEALDELLPTVDWLVITCPLTSETRGLIGVRRLAMLRPTARIIVLSRGGIVEERALVAALNAGELRGAAFDSFLGQEIIDDYPDSEMLGEGGTCFPVDCPLWDHPGVIITPHTSGVSPQLNDRRTEILRENLRRFLAGTDFIRVCDKAAGY